MERIARAPRPDWRERVEALGLDFHTIDDAPYWDETACYRFTAAEIDALDDLGCELDAMCRDLVADVVARGDYQDWRLPDGAAALIEASWRAGEPGLHGRFDLAYDGRSAPRLLEFNADTPTALLEASVIQWEWLESLPELGSGRDQLNSLHERLVAAWPGLGLHGPVAFASLADHAEDRGTIRYLEDTARQAGLDTFWIDIAAIGWDGRELVDLQSRPIATLVKLYPWEWLLVEPFGVHLGRAATRLVEPAWRLLLSSKALLPALWRRHPGHPALLPAGFARADAPGPAIAKPLFGREGANVTIERADGTRLATEGPYGDQPVVWQALHELPDMGGDSRPVLGLWVVAGAACGLGIREDLGPVTRNTSRFVPHWFD